MSVQQEAPARGGFFAKREYRDRPIPDWLPTRLRLPNPILPERPRAVAAYWMAWEAAFSAFRRPLLGSSLVSNYLDPGTDGRLRMLDVVCQTQFLDLAHDLVPGIRALDNFYAAQHADGEICRELEADGSDYEPWLNREGLPLFSRQSGRPANLGRNDAGIPDLTLDGCCHPLLAWAETESYRQTGDAQRVGLVFPPLLRFHRAWQTHLRHASGLYVADWASMDNSPRNSGLGCGVDASAEMVLAARCLATLAPIAAREAENQGLRQDGIAARRAGVDLAAEADRLAACIRERMWDEASGFFYDLRADGSRGSVATIAGLWTLLAGVADGPQTERLVEWLRDPAAFARPNPVPSLPALASGYDPRGGYYRGGVFPALVLMVVRGLARTGHGELAHTLAVAHLDAVAAVAGETGTFWENYSPEVAQPGQPSRRDMVGSGGVSTILLLLEQVIGLRADAPLRTLRWTVRTAGACGCERYWFGGGRVDLLASPRASLHDPLHVSVVADKPISLVVRTEDRQASVRIVGRQELTV